MERKEGWRGDAPHLIDEPLKPINLPDIPVSWFDKLWVWLNGKKLKLGALLTLISVGLHLFGVTGIALTAIDALAILFDSVGAGHKVLKSQTKYGDKGEFGKKELSDLLIDLYYLMKEIIKRLKAKFK